MSMTKTEIMVNEMIAESISKLIEKYQKKAEKDLQDLLDKNIKRVDAVLAAKEKELMSL